MRKAERLGAFMCIMVAICLALAGPPVAAAGPRVDLDLAGADIADVFRALAELGEMNIVLDPAVSGTLTIRLHDLTVEEALKLVAYTTGVEYRTVGSSLIVTPPGKPSAFDPVRVERFPLTHARVDDVMPVLELVAENTRLQADPRTNSVIARGPAAGLEQVKQVISMLDVAVAPPEAAQAKPTASGAAAPAQAQARVESLDIVRLRYASAKSVAGLLSLVVPSGKIQADSEVNAIVMLADEAALGRAHEIIAQVDVAPSDVPLLSAPATAGVTHQGPPAEAEAVKVIKLSWAPAAKMAEALGVVVDGAKIGTDSRTNSLVVRARQSEMSRVEEIAALLDVPAAEPEKPKAPDAPTTEPHSLEAFRLLHADPQSVQRALALVVPAGAVHSDTRTNSLLVFGTPDDTARAGQIIALLDVAAPAPSTSAVPAVDQVTKAPEPITLKAMSLEYADVSVVRDALKIVLPSDNIIVDQRTSKVIVRGTASQHQLASEIVAMLDVPEAAKAGAMGMAAQVATAPQPEPEAPVDLMRVVRLKHAVAAQIREAISSCLPGVRLTADVRTNSLIVVAPSEIQSKVDDLVAALDIGVEMPAAASVPDQAPPEPEPEIAEVVRLEYAAPTAVRQALAPTLPDSKMSVDERTASIVIVGTAAQRKQAKRIIAQLDVEVAASPDEITPPVAPADPEVLHVFQLSHAPAARVREALAPVAPVASMTVDERTNSLIISASRSRVARAAEVIERLDVEVKPTPGEAVAAAPQPEAEVARYRLANAPAESLRSAVSLLVQASDIQVDSRTNTLLVRAVPSVQRRVAELVQGLDVPVEPAPAAVPEPKPALAAAPPEVMRVFRLTHAAASDMKTLLGIVAPSAKMQPDDRTRSLIVLAPASTVAAIDELVRALDIPTAPSVQASAERQPEPDPVVTRVYRLNHAVAADVAQALEGLVKGSVKADVRTSSLVVEAAESQHARALSLIEALDRELPQVLIEARLEELSGDAGRRLGLDWSFNGLTFNQNAYGQWVSVSLDFLTSLTALEEQGKASLISRQHTFTVSGKTGKILIGDRIPVMIQEVQDGVAVTKLDFINAGIELSITPTVSEDGTITATVKPVISSIVGWTPQNYPQIRTRELETIVSLKSGNTAVIGGMLHRDEIESLAKVPILGDIPLIGELFKKRSTTTDNTQIVVMITAWQVNPGQHPVTGPATGDEQFPIKLEDAPTKK